MAALVALVSSTFADTDPAKDLSKASRAQVINYARAEAREWWAAHRGANIEDVTVTLYIDGRAIKHNLGGATYQDAYTNAWMQVLTQLKIDGE